mmetsp:Transcript_116469/g.292912  ORF Transcript_116469/g.292912 Transcript_116469/m.292912 type:complete len:485 (+) Transcript_116469:1131-2585(+)
MGLGLGGGAAAVCCWRPGGPPRERLQPLRPGQREALPVCHGFPPGPRRHRPRHRRRRGTAGRRPGPFFAGALRRLRGRRWLCQRLAGRRPPPRGPRVPERLAARGLVLLGGPPAARGLVACAAAAVGGPCSGSDCPRQRDALRRSACSGGSRHRARVLCEPAGGRDSSEGATGIVGSAGLAADLHERLRGPRPGGGPGAFGREEARLPCGRPSRRHPNAAGAAATARRAHAAPQQGCGRRQCHAIVWPRHSDAALRHQRRRRRRRLRGAVGGSSGQLAGFRQRRQQRPGGHTTAASGRQCGAVGGARGHGAGGLSPEVVGANAFADGLGPVALSGAAADAAGGDARPPSQRSPIDDARARCCCRRCWRWADGCSFRRRAAAAVGSAGARCAPAAPPRGAWRLPRRCQQSQRDAPAEPCWSAAAASTAGTCALQLECGWPSPGTFPAAVLAGGPRAAGGRSGLFQAPAAAGHLDELRRQCEPSFL